jgi:tRNA pseudouridine55 synthase
MHALDELLRVRDEEGEAALEALLLPTASGLAGWPSVTLDAGQARRLAQGQVVPMGASGALGTVRVDDASGTVLGIADLGEDGHLHARRLFRWAV